jgi:hypothetical protein
MLGTCVHIGRYHQETVLTSSGSPDNLRRLRTAKQLPGMMGGGQKAIMLPTLSVGVNKVVDIMACCHQYSMHLIQQSAWRAHTQAPLTKQGTVGIEVQSPGLYKHTQRCIGVRHSG